MSEPRVLAAGIGFTEGPLWTGDGRLLVTSLSRGLVVEIDLEHATVVGWTETGGGPNGLAEDGNGRVWIAQNGGVVRPSSSPRRVAPGLQTIEDGTLLDVVETGLRAPNDLVHGPDGRIWFTDPGSPHTPGPGQVYAYDPLSMVLEQVADHIDFPNGLAFTLDGEELFVAATRTRQILRFAWDGAALVPLGVFVTLPGGPDGLAFDAEGTLYAALPDADQIAVIGPDGALRAPVRFPASTFPTNLCFAGPDRDRLVVTAAKGGRVLVLDGIATGPQRLVPRHSDSSPAAP